jgi:hypothetical protein
MALSPDQVFSYVALLSVSHARVRAVSLMMRQSRAAAEKLGHEARLF